MIKRLIQKILPGRKAAPRFGKRTEVGVDVHHIDRELISEAALRTVEALMDEGYEAYIVGGAVRDLLLGLRPKDFDVATDATPEEVKRVFRRAFIIGRRFRIVHVVWGREVIEVSTFRAFLDNADADQVTGNEKTAKAELAGKAHVVDASGRVLRDNVWGPQDEDATRRDFTINALYYDPEREVVVDYHHGVRDIKKRVLRMIGDPATRYREDPVRIIRAVRFAAKLGFELEAQTQKSIAAHLKLLHNVPQSRLFDEMFKLLQTGHALASVKELAKQGLDKGLFPLLKVVFDTHKKNAARAAFIHEALADTDRRVGEGKPVAPSFLLACLLWHDVKAGWEARLSQGEHTVPALQAAIDEVFDAKIGDISGRGKLAADMREIWLLQPRFERRIGNSPYSLVDQPRFRAGFDFLRLRALVGEADEELEAWWESFSLADDTERASLIDEVRQQSKTTTPKAAAAASEGQGPARKRRRRRKPAAHRTENPTS